MKTRRYNRLIATVLILILVLSSCGSVSGRPGLLPLREVEESLCDSSEGLAARCEGAPGIGEKAVTAYIQDFRAIKELSDDADWAAWLGRTGNSAAALRESVINFNLQELCYRRLAEREKLAVSPDDLEKAMEASKSAFDTEEAWRSSLKENGMSESYYQDHVIQMLVIQEKLKATLIKTPDVSDEDVRKQCLALLSAKPSTRRSSCILLPSEEKEAAEQLLRDLRSGKISFDEAVKTRSTDRVSAEKNGDVGCDILSPFLPAYQNALDHLGKGEISDVIETPQGLQIIQCTDLFSFPANDPAVQSGSESDSAAASKSAEIPEAILSAMREALAGLETDKAFEAYMKDYIDALHMEIQAMPNNLPYDVKPTGTGA